MYFIIFLCPSPPQKSSSYCHTYECTYIGAPALDFASPKVTSYVPNLEAAGAALLFSLSSLPPSSVCLFVSLSSLPNQPGLPRPARTQHGLLGWKQIVNTYMTQLALQLLAPSATALYKHTHTEWPCPYGLACSAADEAPALLVSKLNCVRS